ncbi:MAG: hypothetical protein ACKO0V_07565 [bacterium]
MMQTTGHGSNRAGQSHSGRPLFHQSKIRKTPNDVARPDDALTAPLKNRIKANREQVPPPSEKNMPEMKSVMSAAVPRQPVTNHSMKDLAIQFWLLADAYRPVDVIGIHAILELAQCRWKNRRLFEQYISNNSREKLLVERRRRARNSRMAHRWFHRLRQDPVKSLNQLRQTSQGIARVLQAIDNIYLELDQPDGSWTSRQFETIVNLSGFSIFELWSQVSLRKLWVAWYSSYPDSEVFNRTIFNAIQPPDEFHWRVMHATDDLCPATEGRRQMKLYVTRLQMQFRSELAELQSIEAQLDELNTMAAGWVDGNNSFQHLMHLKHSNMTDRRTRELLEQIAKAPRADQKQPYQLDSELLPPEWRKMLLENRPEQAVLKQPSDYISVKSSENRTPLDYQAHDQAVAVAINKPESGMEKAANVRSVGQSIQSQKPLESARQKFEELYQQLGLDAISETAKARQDQILAMDNVLAAQVIFMSAAEEMAEMKNRDSSLPQPEAIRKSNEIRIITQEEVKPGLMVLNEPADNALLQNNSEKRFSRRGRGKSKQIRQDSRHENRPLNQMNQPVKEMEERS